MNPALRFLLGFEGVTDADAAAIDRAIPAAERLNDAMLELDPIIQRVWPDLIKHMPDLIKAMAIVQREYPDAITVLPVIRKFLTIAKGK